MKDNYSDEINNTGKDLEGEEGLTPSNTAESIYPNAEVRVEKAQYSILHIKRLYEDRKELIINPDFQRNSVWTSKQKNELIESILMGIPIPIIYLFENKLGKKQVVDGRQRITTILDFINNKFKLNNLQILPKVTGTFSELDPKFQGILEDYQITAYVIQPPTPERVKYDIFDRVNRGGTRLNNQEMRNALYMGNSTHLVEDIVKNDWFKKATNKGISPKRMKDKYLVLRTISFYLLLTNKTQNYSNYNIEYKSDIDDFLAKSMIYINENNEIVNNLKFVFINALEKIYNILGENAFRFESKTDIRRSINMSLFESLVYLFVNESINSNINNLKELINKLKVEFDESGKFNGNVDSSTNVKYRFGKIEEFINTYSYV